MAFPLENVLEAIHTMRKNPQDDKAQTYLYEWSMSNDCLNQICQILREQPDDHYLLLSILPRAKKCVVSNWVKYPENARTFYKETFSIKFDNFEGHQGILDYLVEIIAEMALKDWPHDWPSCMDYYIQRCADSPEHCIKSFSVISKILEQISESDNLTTQRRNELTQLASDLTEQFFNILNGALSNYDPELMKGPALNLLKSLCLTAPIEKIFETFSLQAFFTNLILDEKLNDLAIQTLSNILMKRKDSDQIFHEHYQEIIVYLMRFFQNFEDEKLQALLEDELRELKEIEISHLELTEEVYEFILKYLFRYTHMIEDMCVYEDSITQPNFTIVQLIYYGILNTEPSESCIESFWDLWRDILMRLVKSKKSKNIFDSLTPVTAVFDDELMNQMIESFYNSLETAISGGTIKNLSAQASWVAICSMKSDDVFSFIQNQTQMTPKICYALGILNTVLNMQMEQEVLETTLPALLNYNQSASSADFSCSLLYYLSHSTRSISAIPLLLQSFVHLLAENFSSEDEKLSKATSGSFMYSASRSPQIFWKNKQSDNTTPLYEEVVKGCNQWASLSEENALRIYCGIARIAKSMTNQEEERNVIYEYLFDGAISQLQSDDGEAISRGLKLIAQLAEMDLPGVKPRLNAIYVPLLGLVEHARDMRDSLFFMQATATLIMIFKQFDISDVAEATKLLMDILLNSTAMPESALNAINDLRRQFPPVESYGDQVRETYVKPFLAMWEHEKVMCVLQYFRFWIIPEEDLQNIIELATNCIIDARATIGKEACKLLRHVFEICRDGNHNMIIQNSKNIVHTLFTAISDTYHLQVFDSLAKTLWEFYKVINLMSINKTEFDNEVANVLSENVIFADVRNEVSSKLRTVTATLDGFKDVLRELLVSIKAANMSDKKLFKRQLKFDSIRQQLESLADIEEKSAIKAEELELLPMLAKLTISKNRE